jgi:uncharacterized protein (TIGR04255 family)
MKKTAKKTDKPKNSTVNFNNPPVNEVVFGVQFQPLTKFLVPHVGKLWKYYEDQLPICREHPALVTAIELQLGEAAPTITATLMPRSVFASSENNELLIQVQRDAFYRNWSKTSSNVPYPRYEFLVDKFEQDLAVFVRFLEENNLGQFQPLQFELTYLNEIPIGDLSLLKDAQWDANAHSFLPSPGSIQLMSAFDLPEGTGKLHSNFRTFMKNSGEIVYHWAFTARGAFNPRKDMGLDKMRPWFDNARKWIVEGFVDMSTEDAKHKLWKLE